MTEREREGESKREREREREKGGKLTSTAQSSAMVVTGQNFIAKILIQR